MTSPSDLPPAINLDFHGDIVALQKLQDFYRGGPRPPQLDKAESAILAVIAAKGYYIERLISGKTARLNP